MTMAVINCTDDLRTLVNPFRQLQAMCTRDIRNETNMNGENTEGPIRGWRGGLVFKFLAGKGRERSLIFHRLLPISQATLPGNYCTVLKLPKMI